MRPEHLSALQALPERALGIVGTRVPEGRATARVERVVESLARDSAALIPLGPSWIVSGFARGIDEAAHEAALTYGLRTLAVLACGVGVDYPRGRFELSAAILDAGGALVTEFPPGMEPRPLHFLRRNRLIAAYSRAIWVVEAAARSGALNTAAWACRLGKDLYATPAAPEDGRYAGNLRLLEEEYARPCYGPGSFGATWLELAARR